MVVKLLHSQKVTQLLLKSDINPQYQDRDETRIEVIFKRHRLIDNLVT